MMKPFFIKDRAKIVQDLFRLREFLKPEPARPCTWSLDLKQTFIESLLSGYDVPTSYLLDEADKLPRGSYTVVDGLFRISVLLEFLDDGFRTSGHLEILGHSYPSYPFPYTNMTFSQLPPKIATLLCAARFPVRSIEAIGGEWVPSILARLHAFPEEDLK